MKPLHPLPVYPSNARCLLDPVQLAQSAIINTYCSPLVPRLNLRVILISMTNRKLQGRLHTRINTHGRDGLKKKVFSSLVQRFSTCPFPIAFYLNGDVILNPIFSSSLNISTRRSLPTHAKRINPLSVHPTNKRYLLDPFHYTPSAILIINSCCSSLIHIEAKAQNNFNIDGEAEISRKIAGEKVPTRRLNIHCQDGLGKGCSPLRLNYTIPRYPFFLPSIFPYLNGFDTSLFICFG